MNLKNSVEKFCMIEKPLENVCVVKKKNSYKGFILSSFSSCSSFQTFYSHFTIHDEALSYHFLNILDISNRFKALCIVKA